MESLEKRCGQCNAIFFVAPEDLSFLERVSPCIAEEIQLLPPPELCPECRMRRRMAWRNERRLFHRSCDKSGAALVSMFPPDTEFPVYRNALWWDEGNEALNFGCNVDFSRPLFSQIRELQRVVPRVHTFNYAEDRMINSLYVNCSGDVKDCYLIFGSGRDEDCAYCIYVNDCVGCLDCFFAVKCSYCYEGMDLDSCYSLFYSNSCKQCYDSYYLDDCRGCNDCIGCVGLRQKRHYILNQKSTKAEVEKLRAELLHGGPDVRRRFLERYDALLRSTPKKLLHGDNNENSTGDFIWNTKNCASCFSTYNAEDCKYCAWFMDGKDCMDFYAWGEAELCYEISGGGDLHYGCVCTAKSYGCKNCQYLDLCVYCKNCFACVGLKNKQHCILNKQYTEEEYNRLVPRVIELMRRHGEWGEFFPVELSPWAYNHTIAADYYPLSKEKARELGFSWSDFEPPQAQLTRVMQAGELPLSIRDVADDILDVAIICEKSKKPFRLVRQELAFYRRHEIPIPHLHPDERYMQRLRSRNPRVLCKRACMKCHAEIDTTYNPQSPEIVCCEACYSAAVYGE